MTFILGAALSLPLATSSLAASQSIRIQELQRAPENMAVNYPETVVELFTSQGCSSCPPANSLVRDISGANNMLTLSYSVDYWDYLGWKDTFGKPEFSARQRKYGEQFQGQVYTPQIVINGTNHKSTFTKREIRKQVLNQKAPSVALETGAKGIQVIVSGDDAATIFEIRYTPGIQAIPVVRGENRGRTIKLANVVTSCVKIGSFKKGGNFSKFLDKPEKGEALAILVQDGEGGRIYSAANYLP